MVVAGIDAGGSKTVCQVADETGAVLSEVRGPGANLQSIGEAGVEAVLRDVMGRAFDGRSDQPGAICLGIAGADLPREAKIVQHALARIAPRMSSVVVNDALIALEAGAPGAPGVVVASGTGSIVYGRDAHGRAARAGGWGHLLADEGSGFWLGREALRAVLRSVDHLGPPTLLTERVVAHFGVSRPRDAAREVSAVGVKPSTIAVLARDVQAAADAGDVVARRILEEAAEQLTLLARAVVARLHLHEERIVLAGGTFRAAPTLAAAIVDDLARVEPRTVVRLLDVEPARGAVSLALALAAGTLQVPKYLD